MQFNVNAIVLKSERVGESDKRLSIYTRERGRLWALAPGAARPRARLAPATEPCVEARFRLWAIPDNPFARITGGALTSAFPLLRADWDRMTSGIFLCEWTDRLTPLEQTHAAKYELLRRSLAALEWSDDRPVVLAFLTQFLEQAGYVVGDEVLGAAHHARFRSLVADLRGYDFSTPFPELDEGVDGLEERLLRFVTPLLREPLKTLQHRKNLRMFMEKTHSPTAEPAPARN
ncbi:MAG TPA: DNA repair protein RecO [Elusimicrobiota bacterium]|nr:DNA repair protein RecO [Elusimicrobiota bacterium]